MRASPALHASPGATACGSGHALTVNQLALWEHQLARPDDASYGMVGVVRARAPLRLEALRRAWRAMLTRHQVLRCRIVDTGGMPRAIEQPLDALNDDHLLPFLDACDWPVDRLRDHWDQLAAQAWRLDRPQLFRGIAMRVPARALAELCGARLDAAAPQWVLHMTAHHLVIDYLSFPLLLEELQQQYESAQALSSPQAPSPSRPIGTNFWAFDAAQRAWLAGDEGRAALAEAAAQLTPLPPPLVFQGRVGAVPGAGAAADSSAELRRDWSATARQAVLACAKAHDVTPFAVMLSACQVALKLHCGGDEALLAMPVHGRHLREFRRTIGYFANVAIVRTQLAPADTLVDLLRRNHAAVRRAVRLGAVPFPSLRDAVRAHDSLAGRPALAQAAIVWDVIESPTDQPGAALFEKLLVQQTGSPYDLALTMYLHAERWTCGLRYRRSSLSDEGAQRFLQRLRDAAELLTSRPKVPLSKLALVAAPAWQAAPLPAACPADDVIEAALAHHAANAASRTALSDGMRRVSYAALDEDARALAQALVQRTGGEDRIALLFERGIDAVRAIVAAWRAGRCYVPLNPGQSDEWLREALSHAAPAVVLCAPELCARVRHLGFAATTLDDLATAAAPAPASVPPSVDARRDAYIIFTSGSTGRPKGVAVTRASLHWLLGDDIFATEPACWTLAHHTSFDFSVWEMWGALKAGHSLRILRDDELRQPEALYAAVVEAGVTHMGLTPSAAQMLLPALERRGTHGLRTICLGGASVPTGLVARLRATGLALWIYYGPTESTVWATRRRVGLDGDGSKLGPPLAGLRAYVLDPWLQWVPEGGDGELYLAGPQLARYDRAPGLTAAAFLPDPWCAGERMYRTGDRVRRGVDGPEFIGRSDRQVKVNGYRVELDDIEQRLSAATAGLPLCCVQGDDGGLTVVHTPAEDAAWAVADLQGVARQVLPRHVLPVRFVPVGRLPLTRNGKPDTEAAARWVREASAPRGAGRSKADMVRRITEALQEELGREVPADLNFHDAGANSLTLARLRTRLEALAQRPLDLADLYVFGSIDKLAAWLSDDDTISAPGMPPPASARRVRSRRAAGQR